MAGSSRPFTGREVARLAKRAHTTVQRSLDHLVARGLVDRASAGRAWLYTLNREHLAAPAVEALVTMRSVLLERLRDEIRSWSLRPVHASLFGSAARGDGDAASDIDVLVVRPQETDAENPQWQAQIEALVNGIQRWTGNRAAVLDLSEADVEHMADDRPPIVRQLRTDAVSLAGADVRALFPLR